MLTVIYKSAGCCERLCRKDMRDHVATNLANSMHMSLQANNYHQELQNFRSS